MTLLAIFFFNDTATTEIYTLSLHDALPIYCHGSSDPRYAESAIMSSSVSLATASFISSTHEDMIARSEEHTSELQSPDHLVCRLLLEKKKARRHWTITEHQAHLAVDRPEGR